MVVETKPAYQVVGTRPVRPDGLDKVTGRARYAADVKLAGQLEAAVLRSPHAHARIVRIDTARAAALPGVKAIVTAADLPIAADRAATFGDAGPGNLNILSRNLIAEGKVHYRGQPVAAVAAISRHVAQEAARLIEVEYEVLPPVLDVREAMRAEAPILHETLRTKELGTTDPNSPPSNIASHARFEQGDLDAGFAAADIVIEREFTTKMVHQGYIEPHANTALWDASGQITIWTSTQGPFTVRSQVAGMLKHPISKIKVVPLEIGGGFGGKLSSILDPITALLSRKAGHKPVRVMMERDSVFESSGPTSGSYSRIKLGATRDGRLTAAEATLAYEAGAFPGSPVGAGMMCMFGPYDLPAVRIDGFDVVVNKPKTAAYRAPGAPAAGWGVEQTVDELAELLGMDPLHFRVLNVSREGGRQASGQPFKSIGSREVLATVAASAHWNAPLEGPHRGRGLASGFWFNGGNRSSMSATVNPDGTIALTEGSVDIGGTRAAIAMQLAETLGIPYADVKPTVADTDTVGYNDATGGSRTAFASGKAAYECGLDIIGQLRELAAKVWEVTPDEIAYDHGTLRLTHDASKTLTFKEAAARILQTGAPLIGRGSVNATGAAPALATHICDVEVDPDTGKVTILRYTAIQDAGTAVHPSYVEGQMQGGAAQGIGWALNEEYVYDEQGRMANSSYLDYRMPTALDLPMIDTVLVEVPNPDHPYGVRGVGEVPIVPPLAAVANAVYRATGHRFRDLPISPRRITEELHGLA